MISCEHKYVYMETVKSDKHDGRLIHYKKVDRYFCEKCLDQKDKIKEDWSRERPEWY
jgi:hypothetical protein